MRYQDFDLKLSGQKPTGYLVEVLAAPTHRRSEPLQLHLPEGMADWQSSLQNGRFDKERVRAIGVGLFNALFPSTLRSILDESRGLANDENILRLRLDIRAPELSVIPWEILHDGRSYLALERRSAIIRYLYDHPAIYPVEEILAPNILLVVSTPSNVASLPAIEHEISYLSESVRDLIALGKVGRLDILRRTTLQKLQRQLRQHSYQVLHYMGHGTFSHDEGFLALEDERGDARWVDAETLSCFFRDAPLRLLVLNACQTAMASEKGALLGVAHAALACGVPAVVAMQAAVNDEFAAAFAHEFYLTLAEGHPLESCMAEGRKAIVGRATLDRLDWAIPVLFSNVLDGLVWKLPVVKEASEKEAKASGDASKSRGNSIVIKGSRVKGPVIGGDVVGTVGETIYQTIYQDSSQKNKKRKTDK